MITVLPPSYAGPLQAVHCGLGGLLELERKQWARRWQRQCIYSPITMKPMLFSKFETVNLKILLDSIQKNMIIAWRNPISKFKYAVSNSQNCLM